MAKSAEYPDLPWVTPRSWENANRGSVQLIVMHTTEGAATSAAAENGASYDSRRTDGTSCHYFHDNTTTVQCVRTEDIAYSALYQGNRRGIHHELCTQAGAAKWSDSYHQVMLRRAAKQAARDAKKWGIPIRRLSAGQVASGLKGFCGHVDITYAFPGDGGDHTDPGGAFPWTQFIAMVKQAQEDEDMPSLDEIEDRLVPAIMTRLGAELKLVTGEVYKGAVDTSRDGLRAMLWDVAHANRQDAAYTAAPDTGPNSKMEMRNTRDLLEEIIKGCIREVLQEGTGGTPPTS